MTTNPVPNDRRYTDIHSWQSLSPDQRLGDQALRVGITETPVEGVHVIAVELPRVRTEVEAGEPCALIWTSPLSAMPVYAPITGLVAAVNPAVREDPGVVACDPYHAGWLFAVLPTDESSTNELLTAADYADLLGPACPNGSAVSLLQAPSPAVLTTYRKDGTAAVSPVWFQFRDNAFEVVIGEDDVKLRHLAARPRCELVVFEAVLPFRGIRVGTDQPVLTRDGAQQAREQIATRYLGAERGKRFAVERATAGVLLRLPADAAKSWDLTAILPP